MILSLRARLTCWYIGVLAAILLGYGAAIYFYLSANLLREIDGALFRQVRRIEASLNALSQGSELHLEHSERLTLAPDFIQLIDAEGHPTDMVAGQEELAVPLGPEELQRAAAGSDPVMENLTTQDGKPMRVATWRSLGHDGTVDYYIRAGYRLADLRSAQTHILSMLVVALVVALGLAGYGGWMLAGRALRPVDRVTEAARLISATNLKERVEVPPTDDELSRLACTFNQMIARLDEAFDRERRFTDDASHELRTPLAVLRSEIEIALRRERSNEEYKGALQRMLDEILRLNNLVDDVLMLARSDAGLMLEREEIRLDQVAHEVTEFIRPLAEERGIQIECSPSSHRPVLVGDARRLKQLSLNLIENALKFTPAGGRVDVSVAGEGGEAVLRIRDSGVGIQPQDLPRVFDRFFRRGQQVDQGKGGVGLGLAICKWIAEAHGGRIEMESTPGQGTQVTVRLPARGS